MTRSGAPGPAPRGYFGSRWHGHVPQGTLVWWDMVVVGTLINAVTGLASLILLARGVSGGVWAALQLLVLPYNVYLLLAVWRTASDSIALRSLAVCWFGCTLLL